MSARQRHIHITGACGRALGPLAADLLRAGASISASDAVRYAPMDGVLRRAGLKLAGKYAARNVPPLTSLLVKGADVDDANIEVQTALSRGVPVRNMAQWVGGELTRDARRLVVAGTKGKSTTTAMLAWILQHSGHQPDYLMGGLCRHFELPARMRGARWAVLEGDEYPAGKDDRCAKFHYYQPHGLIITNVRLDHADIYPSFASVRAEFERLCAGMPKNGFLLLNAGCRHARGLSRHCPAAAATVGWHAAADHRITALRVGTTGTRFALHGQPFDLRGSGRVLALDAALAALAAQRAGVSLAEAAAALAEFAGVQGRMQSLLSLPGIEFIWDEAYHPLALKENLAAVRKRHPGRRLLVLLQPRHTGGLRGWQSKCLPRALAAADIVLLTRAFDVAAFAGAPFSNQQLAADLRRLGVRATLRPKDASIEVFCLRHARRGDVIYCGLAAGTGFIIKPILKELRERFSA